MNVLELSAVVIAASLLVIAIVAVVQATFLLRIHRELGTASRRIHRELERVSEIAGNIDELVVSAARLERRVHGSVTALLDQIEPPLRMLSTVLAGVRAGIRSWMAAGISVSRDGVARAPARAEGRCRS
jgi:hypothetical protein